METITELEAQARYDEELNECYAPVTVGYLKFYPADILKNCDPIAYRCAFGEWVDFRAQDGDFLVEGYSN